MYVCSTQLIKHHWKYNRIPTISTLFLFCLCSFSNFFFSFSNVVFITPQSAKRHANLNFQNKCQQKQNQNYGHLSYCRGHYIGGMQTSRNVGSTHKKKKKKKKKHTIFGKKLTYYFKQHIYFQMSQVFISRLHLRSKKKNAPYCIQIHIHTHTQTHINKPISTHMFRHRFHKSFPTFPIITIPSSLRGYCFIYSCHIF